MFSRYSFSFCLPHSCLYSHVELFSLFFCVPDRIFAPLVLSSLNSSGLLMVTIFNRAARTLSSPVGVLQMGACSCLIDHLQKVPEWRFLTSFDMPACGHAGNSLFSHMFRNTHKHSQLPSQASDKIRVWYDLTETPHTLNSAHFLPNTHWRVLNPVNKSCLCIYTVNELKVVLKGLVYCVYM